MNLVYVIIALLLMYMLYNTLYNNKFKLLPHCTTTPFTIPSPIIPINTCGMNMKLPTPRYETSEYPDRTILHDVRTCGKYYEPVNEYNTRLMHTDSSMWNTNIEQISPQTSCVNINVLK